MRRRNLRHRSRVLEHDVERLARTRGDLGLPILHRIAGRELHGPRWLRGGGRSLLGGRAGPWFLGPGGGRARGRGGGGFRAAPPGCPSARTTPPWAGTL